MQKEPPLRRTLTVVRLHDVHLRRSMRERMRLHRTSHLDSPPSSCDTLCQLVVSLWTSRSAALDDPASTARPAATGNVPSPVAHILIGGAQCASSPVCYS